MSQPPTNWRTARRTLQAMSRPASARGADAFWSDFHSRRLLHPQHPAAAPERLYPLFFRPALTAACAAALLAGGLLLARGRGMHDADAIQSYSADGRYASVMLLPDDPAQSRIPGICGMESTDEEGGT